MPPKGAPKAMDELSGLIQTHYKGVRVQILRGDITNIVAHVIVNAANTRLQGGGGIDGNIHRAAGTSLKAELKQLYPKGGEVGKAYATGSHNMQPRVRAIVHAIGPNYAKITTKAQKETKAIQLRSAYLNSLDAASNCKFINGLTVVLPCISTGIFGYPMEEAAIIALQSIHDWIEKHPNPAKFERIVILLFGNNDPNEPSYKKAFPIIFNGENNDGEDGDVEIRGGIANPNLYLGEDNDGDVQMFWVLDSEAEDGDDEGKKENGVEGGLNLRRTAGRRLVCERDHEDEEDDSQDDVPMGTGGDPPSDGGGDSGPDSSESTDDTETDTDSNDPETSGNGSSSSSSSSSNTGMPSEPSSSEASKQSSSEDSIRSKFDTSDDESYIEAGESDEGSGRDESEEIEAASPTGSNVSGPTISSDSNRTPTPPPPPPSPPGSSSAESSSDDEDDGDPAGAPARGTRQVVCGLPRPNNAGLCRNRYTYRGGPLGCNLHNGSRNRL